MTPSRRGRDLLCLLLVLLCLERLPKMDAAECLHTADGRMIQFTCSPSEVCCGSRCCEREASFYTHWYFWLAVCMLLLLVLGFAFSACRHFRKQGKSQQCFGRTKPKFGTDLLLNYHLVRTDIVNLPKYEFVPSRSSPIPTIASASSPPLLPPPSYCDACISSSSNSHIGISSHIGNSSHNGSNNLMGNNNSYRPEERTDQPPPSYTECVKQNMMHT